MDTNNTPRQQNSRMTPTTGKDSTAPTEDKHLRYLSLDKFLSARGERYAGCTFDAFETPTDKHAKSLLLVKEYMAGPMEDNLILVGPSGTGKDHLLTAAVGNLIMTTGLTYSDRYCPNGSIYWTNGMSLIGAIRDQIISSRPDKEFYATYTRPRVLAISDPLPPGAKLTDFISAAMFRIIDERYSAMRPTWLTVNVANREELASRLGEAAADRIMHGAVCVRMNVPSWRQRA